MNKKLEDRLSTFQRKENVTTKGRLAIMLFLSDQVAASGLPYEQPVTSGGGQIKGLGKQPVQKILARHGIKRVLAEEGGRTSRGGIGLVVSYVSFLNSMAKEGIVASGKKSKQDLQHIEKWWVGQVKKYFTAKPFKVDMGARYSIAQVVSNALAAARSRQKGTGGEYVEGTVLQHLVAAKLRLVLGEVFKWQNKASTADAPSGRSGDFTVADAVIHTTTAPSDALMEKCVRNIKAGSRPVIVCPSGKVSAALAMAESHAIADQVEVYSAESFISANINEQGGFETKSVRQKTKELVGLYNEIIETVEQNASLLIEQ
jgi:hypothetical protein